MHEKYYCRGRLIRYEVQSTLFLLLKGRLIACNDTFAMNFITEEQIAIFWFCPVYISMPIIRCPSVKYNDVSYKSQDSYNKAISN